MKKFGLIFMLLIAPFLTSWGQRGGSSREEILKAKMSFLVKELSLTEKEASEVAKLLRELDAKRFALWKSTDEIREKIRLGESLSDDEAQQFLDKVLDNRVKEAEIERDYYKKMAKIISIKKAVTLDRLNRKFARDFKFPPKR